MNNPGEWHNPTACREHPLILHSFRRHVAKTQRILALTVYSYVAGRVSATRATRISGRPVLSPAIDVGHSRRSRGRAQRGAQRFVSRISAVGRIGLAGLIAAALGFGNPIAPDLAAAAAPGPFETAAALHGGGPAALALGGLNAMERRLFADAPAGRLGRHSLLEAALVASGVDSPDVLARYEARLTGYAEELKQSHPPSGDARDDAQTVFEFLHRRILRGGYRIDSTDLRTALDEGRFNCVSASVLFQCLAERYGLRVSGLEMPGHAMSRVHLPGGSLDIETTCPSWFRLMDDPKRQAESVRATLGAVPSGPDGVAREVSSVGLVAMVYYNRGVDLLAEARYAEAALANAKSVVLDPGNQIARGNLLATLNNWGIALGQSKRWEEAVAVLEAGLAVAPDYAPFALNYAHVQDQQDQRGLTAGEL